MVLRFISWLKPLLLPSMLKTALAVSAGKLTASMTACLRLGAGTSLPGKIARRIDPAVLHVLGAQVREETLAVTGTNGKTTTCGLLAQFLEEAGKRVVHNQLGANMVPGITAAILRQSNLFGHLDADMAVLEVDEASLKGVTSEMQVDRVVVTNLFRDQLDRYGELDTTGRLIQQGIAQSAGRVLLNSDDPLVAAMGQQHANALYFGIRSVRYSHPFSADCPVGFPKEVTQCPACTGTLAYTEVFFGHLGHYRCVSCGYQRPVATVEAEDVLVNPDSSTLQLRYGDARLEVILPLPGLFNVYNFLAAAAAAYDLGLPPQVLTQGVAHYQSVFGRAERKLIHGKPVMVMLIKNPTGASEVLKLVAGDPKGQLMIALNDNYADGRDVSWIWDAAFEVIPPEKHITVSGVRAEDMAVRLKYAGIPESQITLQTDLESALQQAITDLAPGETLYLLPTYTALLSLRKIL